MDDDWEKAYEEDRRRLEAGQGIILNTRCGGGVGRNTFEENDLPSYDYSVPPAAGVLTNSAMTGSSPESLGQMKTTAPPRPGDVVSHTDVHLDEQEILKIYSQYTLEPSSNERRSMSDTNRDENAHNGQLHDARFNLTCLPAGWNLYSLFGCKMGRRLFFAEAVRSFFHGFLGSKEAVVGCFVTPNCVYIGNVQTGAIITAVDIQRLLELHIFDGVGLGLRTLDGVDLFLEAEQQTQRLVNILEKIMAFWRVNAKVIKSSSDQAKLFRKEMRLIDKKRHAWKLVEDPRTGLRIVSIKEQFMGVFSPIALKIVHWYGFLRQPSKDWKGSKTTPHRSAWITATCLFVAKERGPCADGRNITHCVGIQYITDIYTGPGGELGVVAAAGPPQPPLSVVFDLEEDKNDVLFILRECYNYRTGGGSVNVTPVDSVEKKIRGMRVLRSTRPQLFLMRPQSELYDFLRAASVQN